MIGIKGLPLKVTEGKGSLLQSREVTETLGMAAYQGRSQQGQGPQRYVAAWWAQTGWINGCPAKAKIPASYAPNKSSKNSRAHLGFDT